MNITLMDKARSMLSGAGLAQEIQDRCAHLKSIQARRSIVRCAKEAEEYSWGLKVCKKSFLEVLRVHYEGLRFMMLQSELF
jgi:hypothetical protein